MSTPRAPSFGPERQAPSFGPRASGPELRARASGPEASPSFRARAPDPESGLDTVCKILQDSTKRKCSKSELQVLRCLGPQASGPEPRAPSLGPRASGPEPRVPSFGPGAAGAELLASKQKDMRFFSLGCYRGEYFKRSRRSFTMNYEFSPKQ